MLFTRQEHYVWQISQWLPNLKIRVVSSYAAFCTPHQTSDVHVWIRQPRETFVANDVAISWMSRDGTKRVLSWTFENADAEAMVKALVLA